jgi:hypothetical protein
MFSVNYLVRQSEEVIRQREMMSQEYDVGSKRNQDAKPDGLLKKIVSAVPLENLVITQPDDLSFLNINKFFFNANVADRAVDLKNPNPFKESQAKDGATNVVQSAALQFNDVNGAGVLFASNGAPESLSDQAGDMRLLVEQNGRRNPRLMV